MNSTPGALSGEAARMWALFTDWCAVRNQPALPTTLEVLAQFVDEVPAKRSTQARRLGVIRQVHRVCKCPLERTPGPPKQKPWPVGKRSTKEDDHWLTLPEALERIPTTGRAAWPGRRDAWLLVLLGHVGMHRTGARALSTERIEASPAGVVVDGVGVPIAANSSDVCLACAVTRWLRLAHLAHDKGRGQGRGAVFDYLVTSAWGVGVGEHDCADELPAGWQEAEQLLPAIDQHGWYTEHQTLSIRSMTSIVARRLDPTTQAPPAPRPGPAPGDIATDPVDSHARLDEATQMLDEHDQRVEEAMRRSAQLLNDSTGMLEQLRSLNRTRGH